MFWLAAIPDFLTAAGLVLIWLRPDLPPGPWVAAGMLTLLMEFFVVHAGGFYMVIAMGKASKAQRTRQLSGLAAFYLVLVAACAWMMQAWWMVGAFGWLTVSRIVMLWRAPAASESQLKLAIITWAASVFFFLMAVALGASIPWPALGLTPEAVAASGIGRGANWLDQPQSAVAGGLLYFIAMGVVRAAIYAASQRQAAAAPRAAA